MKLTVHRIAIMLFVVLAHAGLSSASGRPSASLRGGAVAVVAADAPAADSLQQPLPQRRLDTTIDSCLQYSGGQWNMLQSCTGLQCNFPGVACGAGTAVPDCQTAAFSACSPQLYDWTLTIHSDGSSSSWYSCCTE
jgi:hypothetical protein